MFQLDGAEAFLYFSRRRHHWVIGPGPLPIETMQTEAFKGGEYEKKMHEQERQLGFWAEYDAKAGPLASPAFPSRFDPSRWSCWTGMRCAGSYPHPPCSSTAKLVVGVCDWNGAIPAAYSARNVSCAGSSRELPTGLTQTIKVTWYAADVRVFTFLPLD